MSSLVFQGELGYRLIKMACSGCRPIIAGFADAAALLLKLKVRGYGNPER